MKMLGVKVKVGKDGCKIDSSRIEIIKETAKRYELEEVNHCIDYLTSVHKKEIGVIRRYYSLYSLEAIIFEVDDGMKEQEEKLTRSIIKDMIKELEGRQDVINKMIKTLKE